MTIKIKSTRAWGKQRVLGELMSGAGFEKIKSQGWTVPVRIVRESDWRKLMKLVRAVEDEHICTQSPCSSATCKAAWKLKGEKP